jgi:hypothetical protein
MLRNKEMGVEFASDKPMKVLMKNENDQTLSSVLSCASIVDCIPEFQFYQDLTRLRAIC